MTRIATALLILAALAGCATLAGADVELLRFGWEPPLILDGAVIAFLAYQVGKELGDLAEQAEPMPEPIHEGEPLFPDPRA